jgi:hypothetical protein
MKTALIDNGEIVNVNDAPWPIVPGGMTTMPLAEALAAGLHYSDWLRSETPWAERWKLRVWLARQNINPAIVPQLIESITTDGPERWEALARWDAVDLVPVDHPMVGLLWQHIAQMLDPQRTLEQSWEEILNL